MARQPSSPNRLHTEIEYKDLLEELQAVQKRFASKVEALLAVSEDLARCQQDRDKWQTVAQNYERNLSRVEALYEKEKEVAKQKDRAANEEKMHQAVLVKSLRQENEKFLHENGALQIELKEAKGDSKMLRQKLARHQLKEYYAASEDNQSPIEPLPTPKSRLSSQSSVPDTPTDIAAPGGKSASSVFFSAPSSDQHTSLEDFERLREQ
uniref:Uncharacterized protein n=1 Tax=Plectus sambesii TaxID=2011161 RepID=A0A914XPH7_9BILA